MTKLNFVISANREAWIPGAKQLYAADPYIVHILEREGRLSEYEKVEVAQITRVSREEFQHDHKFVNQKFQKYTKILVRRLDEIHGSDYGLHFWKKALSLAILRHVNFCYEVFQVCETNLSLSLHDCCILDPVSYHIPVDFNEHRQVFQNTDFGQEQLFSIYCELFHPGKFKFWSGKAPLAFLKVAQPKAQLKSLWFRFHQIRKLLLRFNFRGATRRLLYLRNPQVGIMNSYFSLRYLNRLLFKSWGRIQLISLPKISPSTSVVNWKQRDKLVGNETGFDQFDKYVFACLRHGMPKRFVEDFNQVFSSLNMHFEKYSNLRWVTSESWIGDSLSSMALAVLQRKGVRHIYNEHNYLAYPFLGNNLKYLFPLVDEFTSLGWSDSSIPNLVRSASLFPWVEGEGRKKEHALLFVSSIPVTRAPEINACYGESGSRVIPGYLEMNRTFFETLNESTLSTMVYRAYPARFKQQALVWDQEFILNKFLSKVKRYDDSDTSGRLFMQSSRLVIINYLSTSYLESLLADIPTIILWNKDAYFLEEHHKGFFDGLIEAKICHTNPVEAANFVEHIKGEPETWWKTSLVRRARAEFLKANIGSPEVLVEHLLKRARESS